MFQVGAASTWETVHLVDYNANVEPGALCEVIVANRSGWAERWGGVRETGSSDNRYAQLHEAEAGGYDFVTMQVVADDDTCIEAYAENTGDIEFYLIGWQVNGASGGGGGGGSSEWNDGGTYLYPTDVGRDIRPNTSGTVGDAGTRWNGIYSVDGDFSNDVTISGGINDGVDFGISGYCLKTDGSGDIYWATDNTGGSFEKLRSEANPWLADSVTFAAGSNVSIAQIGDSIIISSSGTPGGNFVRLCASGSPWLYDSVRFVAGSNITLLQSSNAITISAVITGAIENQKASAQDADFWIDDTGRVGQLVVDSSAVINESGGNYDFRVEGDTDDTLLFTDASEDKIGIGTGSPQHKLDVNGAMYSRRHALTDGATIAVDWNDGNVQSVTLGGNRTFTFSNGQDGGKYILIITQDATGSRTVTWPGTVRWGLCGEPTLSTTANTTDYIGFIYNGVSSTYDAIAVRLGY